MSLVRTLPIAAALVVLGACAPIGRPGPALGAGPITAGELRRDLYDFAADSMRGRETGTRDEWRAARLIAGRLARLGVEPAGDSGYIQRVPLARRSLDGSTFDVIAGGDTTRIPIGEALVPLVALGPGLPAPRADAEGPLVFAGYALPIASIGRNDLEGLDVAGKVAVVVNDAPAAADPAERARLGSREAITSRLRALLVRRPAAVIVLLTGGSADTLRALLPGLLRTIVAARQAPAGADSLRPPMILLGVARAGSPLLPPGWPHDDRPRPLGARFAGHVVAAMEPVVGHNVVGIVRGRDPALAATYVAYGAHLDHIGIRPAVDGDSIANGADDDGSGSVALLALARAFVTASPRPRRSILLVWHTAEEEGLLGSAWYTAHPTVPIDSIVAEIDADMIGRNGADSLHLVGPGAEPQGRGRVLGAIIDSVNATLPRPFAIDRGWDSATDPTRAWYRSDHLHYAEHGIPVAFLTSGLHADYHAVTDGPARIDYDKLARVTELLRRAGVAVADRPARPH